jgi:hypothetical protein
MRNKKLAIQVAIVAVLIAALVFVAQFLTSHYNLVELIRRFHGG